MCLPSPSSAPKWKIELTTSIVRARHLLQSTFSVASCVFPIGLNSADDNHKPEMAIALTPFRGFCGFLPLSLLLLLLSTVPEVRSLIGDKALEQLAEAIDEPLPTKDSDAPQSLVQRATRDSSNQASSPETTSTQKAALRAVFEALMTASDADVADALHKLLARYNSSDSSCRTSFERTLTPLVIELEQQYPSDVGVLCCFVLNVVELQAGEAMFLKADEPHAYISGGESGIK